MTPGCRRPRAAAVALFFAVSSPVAAVDEYVAAAARPTAEVILASHLGDPVFFADVVLRRGLNVAFVRELWRTRRRRAQTVTP